MSDLNEAEIDIMKLPEGKTCADCNHCRRCTGMFGARPENTSCDFDPIRFSLREKAA